MPLTAEIRALFKAADAIAAVPGCTLTDDFQRIRTGLETLEVLIDQQEQRTRDALAAAVLDARTDDIAPALDAAITALEPNRYGAISKVQNDVYAGLRDAYRTSAASNYSRLSKNFDTTADTLRKHGAEVDLAIVDPAELLPLSKRAQNAWIAAQTMKPELDTAASLLRIAASAAGADLIDESHRPGDETEQWLELTVDTAGQHRRRVWEAWDRPHPLGAWGSILAAGFELRAIPLDQIAPYRRPAELEMRYRPVARGVHEPYLVDPEDADGPTAARTVGNVA